MVDYSPGNPITAGGNTCGPGQLVPGCPPRGTLEEEAGGGRDPGGGGGEGVGDQGGQEH